MVAITAQDKEDLAAQSFEEKNDGRLRSPAAAKRMGMTGATVRPPSREKAKQKFGGLVIEQKAMPVIRRSPSWSQPGDRAATTAAAELASCYRWAGVHAQNARALAHH